MKYLLILVLMASCNKPQQPQQIRFDSAHDVPDDWGGYGSMRYQTPDERKESILKGLPSRLILSDSCETPGGIIVSCMSKNMREHPPEDDPTFKGSK